MSLKIHNTLTGKKEKFTPIDPKHIKIYVCGPTVYDFAHIGNARPVVVFDTLVRLLRYDYEKVTYARNITDIDDKIMERALKENVPISEITEKYTKHYEEDMAVLNNKLPDIRPKATDYLPSMIKMIEVLIEKDHAYEIEGQVLFHVPSMENYGELSGRSIDDLKAGARVDVGDYKKFHADFILWKPSTDKQPSWESPWGRGRPGWHLECSCMIEDNFGQTIDIHGGGLDLIFPHHENEIAQSRCSHGGKELANYWMHNGYLTVDGEKMSKSLGNYVTVHDLIKEFPNRGEAIRLCLLTAHYRQPVDFSREGIRQAEKQLNRWYKAVEGVSASDKDISSKVLGALHDDLNTPKAIMELGQLAKEGSAASLLASAQLMGFLDNKDWFKELDEVNGLSASEIEALILKRSEAKANKDWTLADKIRHDLEDQGIALLDNAAGTSWKKK